MSPRLTAYPPLPEWQFVGRLAGAFLLLSSCGADVETSGSASGGSSGVSCGGAPAGAGGLATGGMSDGGTGVGGSTATGGASSGVGGGGNATGGGGNGGSGAQSSGYPTLDAFCNALAASTCEAIGPRCLEAANYFDMQRCLEGRTSACLSDYANGHFDSPAATSCALAHDTFADCGMAPADTDVCTQVLFRENLPPGTMCETHSACASSDAARGLCNNNACVQIPYGDVGADCSDPSLTQCRPNSAACQDGECTALLPAGAPCPALCSTGACDGTCVELPVLAFCPRPP